MTDQEFAQLTIRVQNGKKWIEEIKDNGTYGSSETINHIRLWFQLGNMFLTESGKRRKQTKQDNHEGLVWFGGAWHSKAWRDMRKREMADDDRRAKERQRRAERAERKRNSNLSTSES